MVFDGTPVLCRILGCLLGRLLLLVALVIPVDHHPVPDVQVVGPVHWISLLVFATVTRIPVSIGHSIINIVDLLALYAPAVNHYTATATDSPPKPGLLIIWDVSWRRTVLDSCTPPRLDLCVVRLNNLHGIALL
jgi:hypothetical protein